MGLSDGLLVKAEHAQVAPKIFYTNSAYEYWGRSASLIHTTIDGKKDAAIATYRRILKEVPGIGAILIGEGDLSQELGYPRQYEHPEVLKWMARVVDTCKKNNVPVGHPHVDSNNLERVLKEGFRFLMAAPVRSYAALDKGLKLAGR